MANNKLTCKVCGYQSENLEPHINSDHSDKGGLDWYMVEFNCEVDDVVHPDLGKKESEANVTTVTIAGQEIEVQKSTSPHVPPINQAYHFADWVSDVVQDIKENRRVMLVGHTGCGKSSCIEQVAARINQGMIRVNVNGQCTIGDLVGLWTVKGGETVWVDGILPMCMRLGLWLTVEEIDFAEPAILAVLNTVLEVGGKLTLKEKGNEVVTPHPNFRIFATANSAGCMSDYRGMYQGTNVMNEAFIDRWRVHRINYLPQDVEIRVLLSYIPKLSERIATRIVSVANMIREAFEKEEITCTFSTRRVIDWSEQMIRHRHPIKAAETTVFNKISKEDSEVVKGLITRVMLGSKENR